MYLDSNKTKDFYLNRVIIVIVVIITIDCES